MSLQDVLHNEVAKLEFKILHRSECIVIPLGVPEIDQFLPLFGLQSATINEIVPDKIGTAALGFSAALLSIFSNHTDLPGPEVLWCRQGNDLYAPGVVPFGLGEGHLLLVQANNDRDILWAMEEGLRSGALAAVMGEVEFLTITTLRRLQLAAEEGNIPTVILRKKNSPIVPGLVATRWKVSSLPSLKEQFGSLKPLGQMRWQLELMRCRNGATGKWSVEWRDEEDKVTTNNKTRGFSLASDFCYRSDYKSSESERKLKKMV